ncbi:MAG: hypothetical protein IJ406_06535 [Oscillospiraceae bacterium]|nr:hypothetical protein [Oscillospiraceae bacterium]
MKKILALLLALVMMLSLAACGTEPEEPEEPNAPVEGGEETEEPEEPAGEEVAVAMITDYGDITDQSFNQTTYEACKEFCEAEGLNFE